MCAGFKCSDELLKALSRLDPGYVIDAAVEVIGWAREQAGDHVRHSTYFIDFPANVPDTLEFSARVRAGADPLADTPADILRLAAVARGEAPARSLAGQAEIAFARGDAVPAARLLATAPGMLWRAADRVLRGTAPGGLDDVLRYFADTAPLVSGRVLLSVREHLQNRHARSSVSRIFANPKGRAFVAPETRAVIDPGVIGPCWT
jgi:hypothetical protein